MAGHAPPSGDWFRIEPVAPGVTRIVEPHVHELRDGRADRVTFDYLGAKHLDRLEAV